MFLKKSNRKQISLRNHRKSHRIGDQYLKLEIRNLLAGITLEAGIVEIEGSGNDDVVTVEMVGNDTIEVSLTGFDTETFSIDDVMRVRFRGLNGDDHFTNNSDIDATAYGHFGNDTLIGGGGHNRFQGGNGDDILIGGDRNDQLRGRADNDTIMGGLRHDRIFGGDGDDEIFGEHGRDEIMGEAGNDIIDGGSLEDEIFGNGGRDRIDGGTEDDVIHGGGDDDRIDGGEGNDQLLGGNGDDQLNGGRGNDVINGNAGDDFVTGSEGNDVLRGGDGDDVLTGNDGNDTLLGFDGDDIGVAGDGNDTLMGGDGNDRLFGNEGDDDILGENGDDDLEGGAGTDTINGGAGNDVLFGGSGKIDVLEGGAGLDRLLITSRDETANVDSTDAVIEFTELAGLDQGRIWTDDQINTVDEAFAAIFERTGEIKLLQDSVSLEPIRFEKGDSLEPSNQVSGGVRTIELANWDDSVGAERRSTVFSVIHQMAFTWDSAGEIGSVFPGNGPIIAEFRAVSQWGEGTDVPDGFVASTDGMWFYVEGTEFLNEQGMINPSEDWATIWELALDDEASEEDLARLADKLAVVNEFFDAVSVN